MSAREFNMHFEDCSIYDFMNYSSELGWKSFSWKCINCFNYFLSPGSSAASLVKSLFHAKL